MNPQPTPFSNIGPVPGQLNRMIGNGTPTLAQQTSGSPNFQPSLIPSAQTPMPDKSPMSNFAKGLMGQPGIQPQGMTQGLTQAPKKPADEMMRNRQDLIIKALTSHLANIDKLMSPVSQAEAPSNNQSGGNQATLI